MIRFLVVLMTGIMLMSCSPTTNNNSSLKEGLWRATLEIQDQQLPFNFEVTKDSSDNYQIYFINADERIMMDELSFSNDSVTIPLHIFDASIKAKIEGNTLKGKMIKHYEKDYTVPFLAEYGKDYRFKIPAHNTVTKNFTGTYNVAFTNKEKTTQAIGIFKQQEDRVTGTFLTSTGDYRYLEGSVINDSLHLSAFDGNNMYLVKAAFNKDTALHGVFYSGKTSLRTWTGIRNDTASLANSESITFLKEGYDKIEFAFPDVNGNNISLSDDKYKNKVVILQIFGTWCPNCMDETNFLAPWYEKNSSRGVEIIGLAFERKDDFNYASERVKKMINRLNVGYDFVIAGVNNNESTSKALPMLNKVGAFPTTIFIGRDGKVKKIHTGFSGPGTGEHYEVFKEEFNQTINSLLQEEGIKPKA